MQDPQAFFLNQGILGVIITVLGTVLPSVIIWQQRRLDKKDEEIKALYTSISLVQEKRNADAVQNMSIVTNLGSNLTNATAAIQKSVDNLVNNLLLNHKS